MAETSFKEINIRKRVINFFRRFLRFRSAENFLYQFTKGKRRRSLAWRLVPTEDLYPNNSLRLACRDNINYELDLSNYNDHSIFFGYVDSNLLYLFSLINSEFNIVDVGANIGFTTLNFAKRCPKGSVYSFEPDTGNYKRLERNVLLNQVSNIQLIKKGLGDDDKQAALTKYAHHSGMNRISSAYNMEDKFELIDVVRLDDEVKRLKIDKLNLIKIDAEGYEWNVLQGAVNTIQQFRPILFIEIIERNMKQQGHSSKTLLNWLAQFGYNIIDMKTRLPIQSFERQDLETDILCFPT